MEAMRKQGDLQNQSEQTVGQLRLQVESRFVNVRSSGVFSSCRNSWNSIIHCILNIFTLDCQSWETFWLNFVQSKSRKRKKDECLNRRSRWSENFNNSVIKHTKRWNEIFKFLQYSTCLMSQYWTCDRLSELQSNQAEQARRRDELIHQLEVVQRERDHTAETERIRLQSKLADMSEELHQKLLQKEMKLREDSQKKLADLEKVCVLMKKLFQIWSLSRMVQNVLDFSYL